MKKNNKPKRKKRDRSHIIADLSVNYIERIVLKCGFTTDKIEHDYGYDLVLSTYNDLGEIENGYCTLQVKATDSLNILADGKTISFPLDKRDLDFWADEVFPVFLIVYDAMNEVAYWLYVQAYIKDNNIDLNKIDDSKTFHIQISNVVTTDTIRYIRELKNNIVEDLKKVVKHEY